MKTDLAGTRGSRQTRARIVRQLRLLWDERRFIAASTFCGVLFGVALALIIPPEYRSSARLMPPQLQQGGFGPGLQAMLGKAAGGLGSMAAAPISQQDDGELVIGILRSRTVLDRLITRFDLVPVYRLKEWDSVRRALARNTSVFADRKSGIITLEVTDRDAHRAAAITKAYTEELNRVLSELSNTGASRERTFLEQRLALSRTELETAEKELGHFSSTSATYDLKDQGKAVMDEAAVLQGQLIASEAELEALKPMYGDENVRVRSLRARISELRISLQKIGGRAGVIQANGTDISPPLRSLALLRARFADLYRRARVEEAVYEALKQQYEIARLEEAKQIPNVKVLDVPDVPSKKAFPPRKLLALMGGVVAFTYAIFWLLTRAAWEQVDVNDPLKAFILEVAHNLPRPRFRFSLHAGSGTGQI